MAKHLPRLKLKIKPMLIGAGLFELMRLFLFNAIVLRTSKNTESTLFLGIRW